jgi:hypothetical protein
MTINIASPNSHTVAALSSCTNIPLSPGKAQGDVTNLPVGI